MRTDNPIQNRAYGRALAWMDAVEPAGLIKMGDIPSPVFYNRMTDEFRAIASYTIYAHTGKSYLVDVSPTTTATPMAWTSDLIVDPDFEMHLLHVSYVLNKDLQPVRLSRAHAGKQYRYFYNEQYEAGIVRGMPNYIHPLDRLSKDVVIMRLLQGEQVDQTNAVVAEFLNVELMARDFREADWYNKDAV